MHELDQKLLRKACDQIAPAYNSNDFFCAETRARLLERLDLVSLTPNTILDLGAGTGLAVSPLQARFKDADIIKLDWSAAMLTALQSRTSNLHTVCADAHQLPIADASIDIVISNMLLPGCANPEQIFHEVYRVLRKPGLFLFNTLGPDSFKELRKAWAQVDKYPHVHTFADMHNIGDSLVQAGFQEPVMDVERLTVTYGKSERLMDDLRSIAATNLLQNRRRGLTPPVLWQNMLGKLEQTRDTNNQLPVTLEVITGQAWVGKAKVGVAMHRGEAHFPVTDISTRRKS
ncbi:MAG: methyltransferase domain-containing protein [Gammaproteobacteria bacterium]|nr:methyltransferase domain-containing protein [Gammaproteobacteria bacterium]